MRKFFFKSSFIILIAVSLVSGVFASEEIGTIDSTYKYARGLQDGINLINLGTTDGNITITDDEITGYAWGEVTGWINFAPTLGGVENDGEGNLSGYAWGENAGWINFAPTLGGVEIDSDGYFSGYAWSENMGWISFSCVDESYCGTVDYRVRTDWRPVSARASTPTPEPTTSNTSGSSASPAAPAPTTPEPEVVTPVVPPPPPPPLPTPAPEPTTPPSVPTPGNESPSAPSLGGDSSGGGGSSGSMTADFIDLFDIQKGKDIATNVVAGVREVIQSPEGDLAVKVVSTAGVVAGGAVAASALFLNPLSFTEIFLIPFRIWAFLMSLFSLRKKYRPWGTVYDSITKQPLDPAYVVLKDLNGNEVSTSITDLDGRYGFILAPGSYRLEANKTNYKFPSERLRGSFQDELYANLYFGGEINIDESNGVIAKNIPMDPIDFDWNEFAKKDKKLMKFYRRFDMFLSKISGVMFGFGFVIAVIAFFIAPAPYNSIIFGLYILLMILRAVGIKQKSFGLLEDASGEHLPFAIVRVFLPDSNQEIAHGIADKHGRYFVLVPPGNYYVKIEKKLSDGSYSPIFTSEVFSMKRGIINKSFKVN